MNKITTENGKRNEIRKLVLSLKISTTGIVDITRLQSGESNERLKSNRVNSISFNQGNFFLVFSLTHSREV